MLNPQQDFSVLPLRPKTKIPLLTSWGPYQRTHASNKQIQEWFSNGHAENNIAIVTGKRTVEALDDEEIKRALKDTFRIRTGSGNTNVVIGFREEEFTSAGKHITNRVLWTSGKHSEIRVKGEVAILLPLHLYIKWK